MNMNIQIYSAIWPYLLKCCAFKMLWIFLFVVFFISSFILVMCKGRRDDLKRSVLPNGVQNIHGKLKDLKDNIKWKERESEKESTKLKKLAANKVLRNLQKNLVSELEIDVTKTEEELKELENEILLLTKRTENVRVDILQQAEEYNKCIQLLHE